MKNFNKLIILIKNNIEIIIFFLILMIGIYYRLINIIDNSSWFGDSGRDVLVAKHIAVYKENFFVSPEATGGIGIINNTPVYYWILTFLWIISKSANGLNYFFCLLGILCIPISFLISKEISKSIFRLIFPLFISISFLLIIQSRNIWQPHLIPFFQLLSVLFFIKGLRNNKYFFISVQISFLATFIHLSYFPLLFVTILHVIYLFIKEREYKKIIYLCLIILINTFFYLSVSRGISIEDVNHSIDLTIANSEEFFFHKFSNHVLSNIKTVILNMYLSSVISKYFVVFLPVAVVFLINIYKDSTGKIKEISRMIFLTLISFLLLGVYRNSLNYHYLYPYNLMLLFTTSFIMLQANIFKKDYFLSF